MLCLAEALLRSSHKFPWRNKKNILQIPLLYGGMDNDLCMLQDCHGCS